MNRSELIALANERMQIEKAFDLIGFPVSSFSKQYCPFGELFHQDGGMSRSLRVYPGTNSAFCFAGCGYLSPVSLVASHRGIEEEQAAEVILELTNYVAPDFSSQWDALQNEKTEISTPDLAEALKVACARMNPDWEEIQFQEDVSQLLSRCLSLLKKVRTEQDAEDWMRVSKMAMGRKIGGYSSE